MAISFELELNELIDFSKILVPYFNDFCVVGLTGDLGAGKTTFTKSLVKNLGFQDEVTSPTYSIENEYYNSQTNTLVRHIDIYRGLGDSEINEIFEVRNMSGREIIIIEWANLLSILPTTNYLEINFKLSLDATENCRRIELSGNIGFLSVLEDEIQLKYGKKQGI